MAMDQDAARRNFRDLTKFAGQSTKQIAEITGIAVGTLYNWLKESGPSNLGTVALGRIADALGVTIQELFREPPQRGVGDDDEIRARALQQIDELLAGIDDPEEQVRAANIILATLRATRDEFERKRNPPPRRS